MDEKARLPANCRVSGKLCQVQRTQAQPRRFEKMPTIDIHRLGFYHIRIGFQFPFTRGKRWPWPMSRIVVTFN